MTVLSTIGCTNAGKPQSFTKSTKPFHKIVTIIAHYSLEFGFALVKNKTVRNSTNGFVRT
jgi:hypothetical protein